MKATPESRARLLRYMAEHEPFTRTLREFPDVPEAQVRQLLLEVAEAIHPSAAVHAPQAVPAGGATHVLRVYSDGASRGNPGPAGAGAVLTTADGAVVERLGKYLGRQTNNHAEYAGLIIGLRRARELGAREVEVCADSQLMIRQLSGQYRLKSEGLKPLFEEAMAMLKGFARVKLVHVPREQNVLADEMSNRAIDERL